MSTPHPQDYHDENDDYIDDELLFYQCWDEEEGDH